MCQTHRGGQKSCAEVVFVSIAIFAAEGVHFIEHSACTELRRVAALGVSAVWLGVSSNLLVPL